MKKNKSLQRKSTLQAISPEEAVQFLHDFQNLSNQIDEPGISISLRIPANILRNLKTTAKIENKKYQSMIVDFIRKGLSPKMPF